MSGKRARQLRKQQGQSKSIPGSAKPFAPPKVEAPLENGRIISIGRSLSVGNRPRYKVEHPVNPLLNQEENWDAEDERTVTFVTTEAHWNALELAQVELSGEISEDLVCPGLAEVSIDPLSKIMGHPKWRTGADVITELDLDAMCYRNEFGGNYWQGRGTKWGACSESRADCFDRQGLTLCGNPPVCNQCQGRLIVNKTHYHLFDQEYPGRLCEVCWGKDALPTSDEIPGTEFEFTLG